jgi:hypothetical protein
VTSGYVALKAYFRCRNSVVHASDAYTVACRSDDRQPRSSSRSSSSSCKGRLPIRHARHFDVPETV